jgi:hypothetical protein
MLEAEHVHKAVVKINFSSLPSLNKETPSWSLIRKEKKQLFYLRKELCDCEVRGHCMFKEMPVILVNRVLDKKRKLGKKWRPKEEERQKGPLTPKNYLQR